MPFLTPFLVGWEGSLTKIDKQEKRWYPQILNLEELGTLQVGGFPFGFPLKPSQKGTQKKDRAPCGPIHARVPGLHRHEEEGQRLAGATRLPGPFPWNNSLIDSHGTRKNGLPPKEVPLKHVFVANAICRDVKKAAGPVTE